MNYIKLIVNKDTTVRKFLKSNSFSKKSIDEILKNGYMINNDTKYKSLQLKESDILKIQIPNEKIDYDPVEGKLDIIYEDNHIIVINKDYNLTVNSKNQVSLANYLADYFLNNNINSKIRFINRLDMNTSGLIMIAKHKYAQSYYQDLIEKNIIIKKYIAKVDKKLNIDTQVNIKISYDKDKKKYYISDDGKVAKTILKTINSTDDYSYIQCQILTGKTHQIRLSLSNLGYPIIGDILYGSLHKLNRFYLHSYFLYFPKLFDEENIELVNYPEF